MDSRETLVVSGTFLSMLRDLHQKKEKVALLADCDGITRLEGYVAALHEAPNPRKNTVTLDNGTTLLVEQIVAVNGVFRSDYSEC